MAGDAEVVAAARERLILRSATLPPDLGTAGQGSESANKRVVTGTEACQNGDVAGGKQLQMVVVHGIRYHQEPREDPQSRRILMTRFHPSPALPARSCFDRRVSLPGRLNLPLIDHGIFTSR
ncbi:MAG: hypothetical protein M3R02_21070 [Chloroflexota bacterium]|nr:hypothetical protein [Chloroflexota bacterium]